ncbi:VWA domain-containing protein [Halogeometricum borinquense]|uniref:VWA domain-containing protein n=1 Tax=Halogeometricum borinquense TaxID=60847 RepID=A0A6C0UJ34_9EURY|nr:VWA domain-containing protein [Halogeometricum borinquense]QIB73859.1 VWA domain-containing protein [Halogeometricum borinquense]QIQ76779.1 VWA domain-containing protein [Halogeometricum borinquense]
MVGFELPTGMTVGVERPLFLLALPIGVILLWALVWYRADGTASNRSRRWFFVVRILTVVLLVVSAAGPYTAQSTETLGEPKVTLLVDRSDSTSVAPQRADKVASAIEKAGVPVATTTIASGGSSPIGDGVAANLRENGSVLLLSDGRVTEGRSLSEVTELARSLNTTVSTVSPEPNTKERYVSVNGPSKTSVGVESTFLVSVGGVEINTPAKVTVTVDGEQVLETTIQNATDAREFAHTFSETGTHRITAQMESTDKFDQNDVFRKTVRAVDRPKILYVSERGYPFESYLRNVYNVEKRSSVPEDLSPYYAVVVQDMPASRVGNVDALQEYVIDGNGLLVVGGPNSFENGNYESSSLASMLPVTTGDGRGQSTNIVLSIDVSGSSKGGMRVQKAVSLSALKQLGDENEVGIVGFNHRTYSVAERQPLGPNREALADRIRRLQAGGATDIAGGLRGAGKMLGDDPGTVILISDGHDRVEESISYAKQLRSEGKRIIAIGAGKNPNEKNLRTIARASGGSYFRATETNRLNILFGGAQSYEGEGLTMVDPNTFITSGVRLTANPGSTNDVSIRRGADFLVASEDGTPAVATWRYGLGRVATITTYGADGSLDGLLGKPDSLLLTKSTNYVIGDPERKATGITGISDTRVGSSTTVTYRGDERPFVEGVSFRQVGDGAYRASVTPDEAGFHEVMDAAYAANYRAEYGAFGPDPALDDLVDGTGGKEFTADQGEEIAEFTREQSRRVRSVKTDWTWLALVLALVAFSLDVIYRRVQVRRSSTAGEGGLT